MNGEDRIQFFLSRAEADEFLLRHQLGQVMTIDVITLADQTQRWRIVDQNRRFLTEADVAAFEQPPNELD